MGFINPAKLRCPRGHELRTNARLNEDGHLFCTEPVQSKACGLLVYVLVIPARGDRRRFFAADVTQQELGDLEQGHMNVEQILDYLGATFPEAGVA